MPWFVAILTVAAAYLVGAIPFGYVVARARGVNIFELGSGNIGATNVGRVLGPRFGALVFFLDFAKGAAPVALAKLLATLFPDDVVWSRGWVEVAAGLTAFLGHLFPIYLRFHGGKGVAAGLGAVSVLLPMPALAGLFVWSIVLIATRYMSLASLAAVVVLCAVHLRQPSAWDPAEPRTWFCLIAGTLVFVRHRANLKRLWHGNENQLKDTTIMRQLNKSLHVLALGMWFGMSMFFTWVVAFTLFGSFETLGQQADDSESWFPRPPMYNLTNDDINGPKEQGTRAAGHAIGPMFVWYFALQGVCGFIALATSIPLLKLPAAVHRWRVNLLIAAIALVLLGWPLERKVDQLRVPRNHLTDVYLRSRTDDAKKDAKEARHEFAMWHLGSVMVNLLAIVCVTSAMALAGNLDCGRPKEGEAVSPEPDKQPEPAQP
jgi:acyl-phosphate glycerol 3-phosphate acyltransferase